MNDKDLFDKAAGMSGPVILLAFLAGAAGGVIRWITLQESWKTGLTTLVASSLMGGFVAPILSPDVAEYFGASLLVATSFLALLIGIVSLTLSNVLIRFTKTDAFVGMLSAMFHQFAVAFLARRGMTVSAPPPLPPAPATQDPPTTQEEGRP